MNVFDNSDTRAVVAVVHCYENHAQDARVQDIEVNPTLGSNNGDCLRGADFYMQRTEVKCYENHATDARVKEVQTAPTGGGTHNGSYENKNPIVLCKFTR